MCQGGAGWQQHVVERQAWVWFLMAREATDGLPPACAWCVFADTIMQCGKLGQVHRGPQLAQPFAIC